MPQTVQEPDTDPAIRADRLRTRALETGVAVSGILPGDWKPVPSGLYQAAIGDGDGRQLILTVTTGAKGEDRLKVSTRFDRDLSRFATGYWEIGMTLAKSATAIARDIERRLLPDLDAELVRARAAQAAEEARQSRVKKALTRIEWALPSLQSDPAGAFSTRVINGADGLRGEFTISADGHTGNVQLRSVPLDLLAAVAAALDADRTSPGTA
jgi:hypothetical protein